jgi:hypothetical protein
VSRTAFDMRFSFWKLVPELRRSGALLVVPAAAR